MALTLVRLLAASAWLFLSSPPPAHAHYGVEAQSPCDAARGATVVFVGTVIGGERLGPGPQSFVRYRFRVDELLKGTSGVQIDLTASGRLFRTGEQYLVYSDGASADSHDRTGPLDARVDDVEVLRAMRAGAVSPRIFGTVVRWMHTPDGARPLAFEPVRGVAVVARQATPGTATGRRWKVTTDAQGRFRVLDLKPGRYRVEPVLSPAGRHWVSKETTVELDTCASETLVVVTTELLRGRMTMSRGGSVGEGIPLTLIRADASRLAPDLQRSVTTRTDASGNWSFEGLPPGRYRLGVNVIAPGASTNPHPRWWYPGSTDAREAQDIEVTEGHVRLLDVVLPPSPPLSRLTGRVVRPSGRPALRATVWLYEVGRPAHDPRQAWTDVDGRFAVDVPAGRRFWVYASDTWPGEVRSEPAQADARRPLLLTLSQRALGQRGLPDGW